MLAPYIRNSSMIVCRFRTVANINEFIEYFLSMISLLRSNFPEFRIFVISVMSLIVIERIIRKPRL